MKIKALAVAGLAAAGVAGFAHAEDTVGAFVVNMGEVVTGHTTFEVRLDAVGLGGLAGVGEIPGKGNLQYQGGMLWNASGAPAASNDFNSYSSAAGDSWLALGGYDAGSNPPQWTPGYSALAASFGPGQRFIVKGTSWGGLLGEGYFTIPAFIADSGNGILVAQFTVEGIFGAGELPFYFEGAAGLGDGGDVRKFVVQGSPAPGALALLGLAGLAGRRRRA